MFDDGENALKKERVGSKKTNAFHKSDEAACQWVFLSAVKQFQETAQKQGVNRVSYDKKNTFRSTHQHGCHAGGVMAGAALKGDIAR